MTTDPSAFERIHPHAGSRALVRLTRDRPSNANLHGFVLGVSSELVLMHTFHDFFPEGYSVVRTADVIDIRSGDYERHFQKMLAGEGLLGGLAEKLDIDLASMRTAIESIQRDSGMMGVRCEDESEDIEDYYVGTLVRVSETSITFDNFDALGVWDETPFEIEIDQITLVDFRTPYIKTFSRYLDGPPPNLRPGA